MPRGKKSPVKRKTRKTSPRRKVSPKKRVRKTSPRKVKRKTSPRRKTYRRRLNPPTEFDTNRELMERSDFLGFVKRTPSETREHIDKYLYKSDFSGKGWKELSIKEVREFLKKHGKCIRDVIDRNLVPNKARTRRLVPKYALTIDDIADLCNTNYDDFEKIIFYLADVIISDVKRDKLGKSNNYTGTWYMGGEMVEKWYTWDWEYICKRYGAL